MKAMCRLRGFSGRGSRRACELFLLLTVVAGCQRYRPYKQAYEPAPSQTVVPAPPNPNSSPNLGGTLLPPTNVGNAGNAISAGELGKTSEPPIILAGISAEPPRLGVGREFEPVYFDQDSYELTFTSRKTIHDHAGWLAEHPSVWVTLEGHCDKTQTVEYGYYLGAARAVAVKERMTGIGVSEDRLFTIGFSQDRPTPAGVTTEHSNLNRRVEFMAFIAPPMGAAPSQIAKSAPPPEAAIPQAAPRSMDLP